MTHAGRPHRRLGVLRLRLHDGSVYDRQLLVLDADGHLLSHSPLTAEEPFCEWFRGEWVEA